MQSQVCSYRYASMVTWWTNKKVERVNLRLNVWLRLMLIRVRIMRLKVSLKVRSRVKIQESFSSRGKGL